jgi:predicted  nucleic acid-binding Zn-ribbon protein
MLQDLERELQDIRNSCNQDMYTLGVHTYTLNQLPEEVEKLNEKIRNKNIDASKIMEKIEKLKKELPQTTPPVKTVTPEVVQ